MHIHDYSHLFFYYGVLVFSLKPATIVLYSIQ